MSTVLLAGVTGQLGRRLLPALQCRGHRVSVLVRDPARLPGLGLSPDDVVRGDLTDPASLRGACEGVDAVFSCAGASMQATLGDRLSFDAVDHRGNVNLLGEARRAGVQRFGYVSLFGAGQLAGLAYVDAHERFVDALGRSGLSHVVVRPTGFFSAFDPQFDMARKGRAAVVGPGTARTNPIHEADLAEVCVDALEGEAADVPVGGPEVFTRRQIVELALRAAGRVSTVRSISPGVVAGLSAPLRVINPRLHALIRFGAAVSMVESVAPAAGSRTLEAYFRERAAVDK